MNLSTVRYFVEKSKEDRSSLFEGLSVWSSPEARKHFQRYPVIALTFKDIKAAAFDVAFVQIKKEIAKAYREHSYLLREGSLEPGGCPIRANRPRRRPRQHLRLGAPRSLRAPRTLPR